MFPQMQNFVYHATFRSNLQGIRKKGLEPGHTKNWADSKPNVICLSSNPDIAYSYCESAEEVSEVKYGSGIVMLAIPIVSLNTAFIRLDSNIRMNNSECYEYGGRIPSELIYVCSSSRGIIGPLATTKRVPSYE